jgi:metal-dependent amidase/aminoacylase/carboxypeptidase family protein
MSSTISSAELLARANAIHEDIRTWRRTIHRYPELTFTEQRTAGLVNATLVDLGIATETEVAKTGVVGHIRGGDGPVVGLRADMDALPIQEVNGAEFDSTRARHHARLRPRCAHGHAAGRGHAAQGAGR